MNRALSLMDLIGVSAVGVAVYKTVELGPYEMTIILGRCVRVFITAAQGYI
jgi:hypothetical protein